MNKKVVTFTIAMVLLLGITMGATFALLSTKTDTPVVNTFVAGNIGTLNLYEHELENGALGTDEVTEQTYTVIPGATLPKDPTVTYTNTSGVAAYVFVGLSSDAELVGSSKYDWVIKANDKDAITFSVDNSWAPVDGYVGVYYKEVEAGVGIGETEGNVLKDKKVVVNSDITTDDLASFNKVLTFNAYAIQQESFNGDAAAAWAEVSDQANI